MEIHILDTEERRTTEGEYVVYEVSVDISEACALTIRRGHHSQWRRYSEFDLLRRFLAHTNPECIIPPLPEKTVNFKVAKMYGDKFDPLLVLKRRTALTSFLGHIAEHPILQSVPVFHSFLIDEDWRKELVIDINGERIAWTSGTLEERITALGSVAKPRSPDKRFTDLRSYADMLQEKLSTAINNHMKMAKQAREVFTTYGLFSTTFNEWSDAEMSPMSSIFREHGKALGLLEDKSAATLVEEDMKVVDKLREYMFYCDALREFVARQEAMQVDYERAVTTVEKNEQALAALKSPDGEKGIAGFLGRMQKMTPQEREEKINTCESGLVTVREALTQSEQHRASYLENAIKEIERFQQQKAKEIRTCFSQYARIQTQFCQQSLAAWKRARRSLDGPSAVTAASDATDA